MLFRTKLANLSGQCWAISGLQKNVSDSFQAKHMQNQIILFVYLTMVLWAGSSIWFEQCRLRSQNWARHSCRAVSILRESKHGKFILKVLLLSFILELYLSLKNYANFVNRAAWLHRHYLLAQCSFNKLLYRPHSTTATLRLWNQDLTHRYEARLNPEKLNTRHYRDMYTLCHSLSG
jgi:hypothetical protein